jgi:hypothetical protein
VIQFVIFRLSIDRSVHFLLWSNDLILPNHVAVSLFQFGANWTFRSTYYSGIINIQWIQFWNKKKQKKKRYFTSLCIVVVCFDAVVIIRCFSSVFIPSSRFCCCNFLSCSWSSLIVFVWWASFS